MEEVSPSEEAKDTRVDPAVAVGVKFLMTLFAETDTILFRPIETWIEGGKKRSRVDYRNTTYRLATAPNLNIQLARLLQLADAEKVNIFFGVCPRQGLKGRFDLAWQIRRVRVLWTDIDHVTVEEARERIAKSGLPQPSIIVSSGNGVHLYWLLESPYLIDDAGDPPPVETEWTQAPGGRKKPRKYIVENGDKVYLDQRRHLSRLGPKAQYIQDVLAGIATALGGDHTTDLARLLRVPGSLNRKDQRNGKEPLPTALIECDASRKYALTVFERLKSASPETERAKQITTMPLPQPRKPSLSKADKLAELIAACGIATAGNRSEADFAVCCYAIRNGVSQEDVWTQVQCVGKFGEQGRRYFDVTWADAEYDVRVTVFEQLQKQTSPPAKPTTVIGDEDGLDDPDVAAGQEGGTGSPVIRVDASTMQVGNTLHKVTDRLLAAGNCFSRAEQLVAINDQQINAILSAPELAGLLNQHVEFYFINDEVGEYKPFPAAYANTWLNHHIERSRLPVIKLFSRNPVYTEDWRLVAPGFDARSGIYYAGTAVRPLTDTTHLDLLLRDFCFKKPADRTNYLGVLLTAILMPRFIGSKPAVLFNGNQPELGKSILAQIISILRDGQPAETASYNPNDEEFEKRLGAIVRRGATTIIIDNAKPKGRNSRIDSPCLERSITDSILSFRLLGQSDSIRAENSHIFCITANAPDVSRDLVTRSVVINLYYEGDPEKRTFSIADPEGFAHQHRIELLGELVGMVERWKAAGMPLAMTHSRFNKRGWGNIAGGVLESCGEPDFLANAEEAGAELDETRREFAELVDILADHPQGVWSAAELVELCSQHGLLSADLGDGSSRSQATKMGTLAGRFIGDRFPLSNGHQAVFHRSAVRKGNAYRVSVEDEMPNLGIVAEPMPNLVSVVGTAH